MVCRRSTFQKSEDSGQEVEGSEEILGASMQANWYCEMNDDSSECCEEASVSVII